MLIGVMSDSHGRTAITRAAVRTLVDRGAQLLVHLGDFETEAVMDELAGHDVRLVLGNCDWDVPAMTRYAERLDLVVEHPMGSLIVERKQIAFTHGHMASLMTAALSAGVDYLLHGHTHEVRDERIGATRIINPGALFRAPRYTVALLDPVVDDLEIIEIDRTAG